MEKVTSFLQEMTFQIFEDRPRILSEQCLLSIEHSVNPNSSSGDTVSHLSNLSHLPLEGHVSAL